MIKAGIIGATGYAGGELVRILMGHKDVEVKWYGSRSYIDQKYAAVYQNLFQIVEGVCKDDNMEELANQVDVIFTATPQGYCASLSKTRRFMKSGTRSSTKVRSFYRKRCTDCVKLTGRRSRGQEFWQIRDVIRLARFFPSIRLPEKD